MDLLKYLLFNNLEMEIDFKYIEKFKGRVSQSLREKNIDNLMFMFGLIIGTKDSMRKFNTDPFLKELKDEYWDVNELRQVQNGWDNIDESPNIPTGILFLVNQLEYVVQFNKSKWAYYYLLGNAVGLFNSDEIKNTELHYFINKIPNDFIKNHHKIFEQLINDFILKEIAYKFQTEHHFFYPVESSHTA